MKALSVVLVDRFVLYNLSAFAKTGLRALGELINLIMPNVTAVILLFFYSICLCVAINDNPDDTAEEGQPNEQEVKAAYLKLQFMMAKETGKCCITCLTAALATSVPGIEQDVASLTGDPYATIFAADIKSEVVSAAAREPYIYRYWSRVAIFTFFFHVLCVSEGNFADCFATIFQTT